jgi:hypothetical protein
MAQPILYNQGDVTPSCCIKKGYFDIGIIPTYAYGPTNTTGFFAGYPPGTPIPTGGFVSYQNKASQGPSIYNIPSVNDLVYFGTQLNLGAPLTTPEEVIRGCFSDNDIVLVNIDYPEIPINGNILTLDAGYTASYPWMQTNWKNIATGASTAVVTGTTPFVSGSSTYNYSDSYLLMNANAQNSMALLPPFASQLNTFTVNVWIKVNTGNDYDLRQNIIGQQYSINAGYTPQDDCNFLIRGNGTNGYQGLVRSGGSNFTVDFGAIAAGAWTMLTLTFDGTFLSAWVNSGLVSQSITGALINLTNNLQTIIGGTTNAYENMGTPAYFDGYVGVVNIYDIPLNSGEIIQLYDNYKNQRNYL